MCGLAAFPDGGPPSVLPAVATGECAQVRVVTHLWVAELGIGAARVASWLRDVVAGASTSSRCRVWWRRHNGCGDWTTVVRLATTAVVTPQRLRRCGVAAAGVATSGMLWRQAPADPRRHLAPVLPASATPSRRCHLAPVRPRAGATRQCHPGRRGRQGRLRVTQAVTPAPAARPGHGRRRTPARPHADGTRHTSGR